MQPGVGEQLAGIRAVLERVVAPAVGDAYLAAQLRAVVEALAELEAQWSRALPLLMRENDELASLLDGARRVLAKLPGAPAEAELRAAAGAEGREPEYPDFDRLAARNRELRGLVSRAVRALHAAPAEPARDALRERIRAALAAGLRRRAGG